ncbi:Ig-like domain-containing protein [Deinococcus ficus]|nr:Ig-like domain-containing protein [Deinococcus ficus]
MNRLRMLSALTLTGMMLASCGPTADTTAPTISLDATPATVTAAGSVNLKATATDAGGVSKVTFYRGATELCVDTTAPYECTTTVAAADNGTITYRAVATDTAGNTAEATDSVMVTIPVVVPDTTAPTITQVDVTSNSVSSYTVNATATDNVGVSKIEFYLDGELVSTDTAAPYSADLSFTAASNGEHTVVVKAYDAAGNVSTSSQTFTVNIDATKPSVSLQGAPVTLTEPGDVTLTATASDDQGVIKVEFYDNGTLIATDTEAPYTTVRSYTAADNGTHTMIARAYDAQGNTADATTTITVDVDTTAPTVVGAAVPSILTMPGTATFTATATDDRGVTKVEFYDNGTLIATDTEAPYTTSRAYAFADNGVHTINFKAYDAQGNVGTESAIVTVAITDANEPNDSIDLATTLTIGGTPIDGTVAGQGRDMDYFKFDAAAGDMLKLTVKSVSVNSGSTLDPYVEILMPDGKTILEKDDDSGVGLESEIRFNAPATGTYTVIVTSFDIHDDPEAADDKATNTYQIALTRR